MDMVSMDVGVARDTAAQLKAVTQRLDSIESAFLDPIVTLAKDGSIIGGVRDSVVSVAKTAYEAADYISEKADALEAIANAGWTGINQTPASNGAVLGQTLGMTAGMATEVTDDASASLQFASASMVQGVSHVQANIKALDELPRLQKLIDSGEIDQAKYAELIEFFANNSEFSEEEYFKLYRKAIDGADADGMKILTAALWDRLEKLDRKGGDAAVLKFWNGFMSNYDQYRDVLPPLTDQQALAVLMAAGGLPKVPAIIGLTMGTYDPYDGRGGMWAGTKDILAALGHPMPADAKYDLNNPKPLEMQDWENRQKWWDGMVAANIDDLARTKDGGNAVINSFAVVQDVKPMWDATATNNALLRLARQPGMSRNFLFKTSDSYPAQKLADQLSINNDPRMKEVSQRFVDDFFSTLVDGATNTNVGDAVKVKALLGLSQFQRALMKAGRPQTTLSLGGLFDLAAIFLPTGQYWKILGKSKAAIDKATKLIGEDGLLDERESESGIQLRSDNLAYLVQTQEALRDPSNPNNGGAVIAKWFADQGIEGPLSVSDWRDLELAADADDAPKELRDAVRRHAEMAKAMDEEYNAKKD